MERANGELAVGPHVFHSHIGANRMYTYCTKRYISYSMYTLFILMFDGLGPPSILNVLGIRLVFIDADGTRINLLFIIIIIIKLL